MRRAAVLVAALLAPLACFSPAAHAEAEGAVGRLVAMIEASPGGCREAGPATPGWPQLNADVEAVRRAVPEAAEVPIAVADCYWDGMVVAGERVVVSTRLARASAAQRFFIVAHELGHVAGRHHQAFGGFVERLLQDEGGEPGAAAALRRGAADVLSRRHEEQADAFAVAAMRSAGLDVEEAARFWDDIARRGFATPPTHPAPAARAAAIRALAARAETTASAR